MADGPEFNKLLKANSVLCDDRRYDVALAGIEGGFVTCVHVTRLKVPGAVFGQHYLTIPLADARRIAHEINLAVERAEQDPRTMD